MKQSKEKNRRVDSDSSESSDDEKGEVIVDVPQGENNKKGVQIITIVWAICLIFSIALYYYQHQKQPNLSSQQTNDIIIVERNATNSSSQLSLVKDLPQEKIMQFQPQPQPQQNITKLELPSLLPTKQFGNSYFLFNQLYQGTMHWIDRKQIICLPDMVINSASKLSQNLYLQKTAYTYINIMNQKVSIPAENLYQYEGIRQLLKNLTKSNENIIAYAHRSPLLLILATSYSKKGIFVQNSSEWQLFQNNLIVNDLLPLAKPVSLSTILSSNGYNVLISQSYSFVKTLLFQQKRQIVLLVQINEPITEDTYVLLKLKVYRFQNKQECQDRKIEIYEQSTWHIDQKAVLMPNWYLFTIDSLPLPLAFEKKNYQSTLLSHRKLACIKNTVFKPQSTTFNSDFLIEALPYEGMQLFKSKMDANSSHFKPILTYFSQNPVSNMYIHSGPFELMLLMISTYSDISISLNQNYNNSKMLKKNLVLNNLEVIFRVLDVNNVKFIITTDLTSALLLKSELILLIVEKQGDIQSKDYSINSFTQEQECIKTVLTSINTKTLSQGVYLLTRHLPN